MFFGKPLDKKVKPAHAAFRADMSAPAGPVFHKSFITDQMNDLIVGSIFQQTTRRPVLIQPPFCETAFKDFAELTLVEIVIPNVRKALCSLHDPIIRDNPRGQGHAGWRAVRRGIEAVSSKRINFRVFAPFGSASRRTRRFSLQRFVFDKTKHIHAELLLTSIPTQWRPITNEPDVSKWISECTLPMDSPRSLAILNIKKAGCTCF